MNWIKKLNEKMNYNQEMFILFGTLTLIFLAAGNIFIGLDNKISSDYFVVLASITFGIAGGYFIYNRNDDPAHGYKVRDKIRRCWKRFKEAEF